MLRIITGTAKNMPLKSPQIEGYRGVQDVAKGAVFSIIGQEIVNSTCLDLFAGSGNLGLEALSRGAAWCDFVDAHKNSIRAILDNLEKCKFTNAEVINKDAVKFAANTEKSYDFIFLDPFYEDTHHIFLMENLEEILKPTGTITFFHGEQLNLEKVISKTKLKITDTRKFGKSYISILKK